MVTRLLRFLWRPAVTIAWTLALPTLYFLSVGLAILLLQGRAPPEWGVQAFVYFYSPLVWLMEASDALDSLAQNYAALFIDDAMPAPLMEWPDAPPFFREVFGTCVGAWLIWNFVRWVNQRKVGAP